MSPLERAIAAGAVVLVSSRSDFVQAHTLPPGLQC